MRWSEVLQGGSVRRNRYSAAHPIVSHPDLKSALKMQVGDKLHTRKTRSKSIRKGNIRRHRQGVNQRRADNPGFDAP